MIRLQEIFLLETSQILMNILRYVKVASFIELPREFQLSLIIYDIEKDPLDGVFKNNEWVGDKKQERKVIEAFQERIKKKHYPEKYRYGYVPTQLIIDKLVEEDPEQRSWDEWYDFYASRRTIPNHGESILALLVQDDDETDDFLEDGWHRFHSYVQKGIQKVPIVFFRG